MALHAQFAPVFVVPEGMERWFQTSFPPSDDAPAVAATANAEFLRGSAAASTSVDGDGDGDGDGDAAAAPARFAPDCAAAVVPLNWWQCVDLRLPALPAVTRDGQGKDDADSAVAAPPLAASGGAERTAARRRVAKRGPFGGRAAPMLLLALTAGAGPASSSDVGAVDRPTRGPYSLGLVQ